jgi:hypothetical protein
MMRHRNLFTNVNARLRMRAWRFSPVAIVVLLCVADSARSAIIPIFYNSLDSDAAVTSADYGAGTGGAIQNSANHTTPTYPTGVSGGAFQSTSSSTNAGGWVRWSDAAISTIFNSWANGNGITLDLYFQGTYSNISGSASEGLWSMVRRNNATGGGGDTYLFASVISSTSQPGRLRFAFSNDSTNQYKFTLNNTANAGEVSTAGTQDLPLSDGVTYHLTMNIANGVFNVYLDDVGGNTYSNASPVYTNNTFSSGYYWALPAAGNVTSSGTASKQTREMDVGIRGFGNTANNVNNFGGTLRNGNWVDEVKVYNGVYAPSDLIDVPEPASVCLLALVAPMLFLSRKRG